MVERHRPGDRGHEAEDRLQERRLADPIPAQDCHHLSDTDLLAAIESRFNVLVTLDRNLTFQQKIAGRSISVIVLRMAEQTPEAFRALLPPLAAAIRSASSGHVRVVGS